MTDIKALLKQYEEVNAELNKQIQENGNAFITQVFQEIFDQNEGLKYIHIIGWTPGFNDGEPCTHSQESAVGSSHTYYSNYYGRDVVSHDFEDREWFDEFEVKFSEGSNTVVSHINSGCKTLDRVAKQVSAYDELIERVFNTNFELKISTDDNGKVVVDEEYYNCGY